MTIFLTCGIALSACVIFDINYRIPRITSPANRLCLGDTGFGMRHHDEAQRRIMAAVEMPDRLAQTLILFIQQNNGKLPKRRREKEFGALTDNEVTQIENIYNDVFGGD